MSDKVRQQTLQTPSLTARSEPEPEVAEPTTRTHTSDPDDILARWVADSDICHGSPGHSVRIAKLNNGYRGLQLCRFEGTATKKPHHTTALLLSPDEFYSLAQCIFRESALIKQLCLSDDLREWDEIVRHLKQIVTGVQQ